MPRPSLLVLVVAAAALPALAVASPVTTPIPVTGTFDRVASRGDFDVQVREGATASVEESSPSQDGPGGSRSRSPEASFASPGGRNSTRPAACS